MRVADAVLALDGGNELVHERVQLPRLRPRLPLQVLQELLIRRVELHACRQARQVLDRRRLLKYNVISSIDSGGRELAEQGSLASRTFPPPTLLVRNFHAC
jgi:hypothetical protein